MKNDLIWECNISSDSIAQLFVSTELWIQVWIAWTKLKQVTIPNSKDDVLSEILWFNQHILKDGVPWISVDLQVSGILQIQDIYDGNWYTLLTFNQLCDQHGRGLSIMDFNSIIAGIPHYFKLLLQNRSNIPPQKKFSELIMSKTNIYISNNP